MRMITIALPASILALGLASGCSAEVSTGSNDLDISKLESTIASGMQEQLGLDGKPTVTCPESVPIQQGNVFTCTAELNGDRVDVKVTQTDDQGNVNWEVVQPSEGASAAVSP